jgi:hypothetical protein
MDNSPTTTPTTISTKILYFIGFCIFFLGGVIIYFYFFKNKPLGPKTYLQPTIQATCPTNYTLSTSDDGLCVQNCSPGYTSISNTICERNSDSRPTILCDGNMCTSDFTMHRNSIGSTCPSGYYHNDTPSSYKNPRICVKNCDPGYYHKEGNECYRTS